MPQEKTLPHSLEAERAVLAAMMMDREATATAVEMLGSNGFYSPSHQKIFDAICELFNTPNQPLDITSLAERLRERGELVQVGGIAELGEILQSAATSANIAHHVGIVKERSLRRDLIRLCSSLSDRAYEETDEIAGLVDDAEKAIFSIAEQRTTRGFVSVRDLLGEVMDNIESAYKHKNAVTGVATGYPDLDNLTSGLQKSNLVILAARPSVGKTSFALNIAQNVAIKDKVPVAIFSLEMSADQIITRILCSEARVDLAKVRSGYISADHFKKLTDAARRIYDTPIYIDDTPGLTINEIRSRARRLASEEKSLGLIVLDYIQLVTAQGRIENRQQEVSQISRMLKAMARDLDLPVLALSQLSRAIEKRDDPLPRLSDLRESGAIEQDADVVMFIHRQVLKKMKRDDESEDLGEEPGEAPTKLIIGKQRNGPTGIMELYFAKHYTRFEPLAPDFGTDLTPF